MIRSSGMSARQPRPATPEVDRTLPGMSHLLDCTSALSAMQYDSRCMRCSKIKAVVFLRRKTIRNGAAPQEFLSAKAMADRLIAAFGLTRGEVYDREYPQAALPPIATVRQRRKEVL